MGAKKIFRVADAILEIVTPILFLVYGISSICFSRLDYLHNQYELVLEILLILAGVAKIVNFIGGHKIRHEFNFDIAFGIISIALGFILMAKKLDLSKICLFWGIFEVVEGAFEVQHLIVLLKEKDYIAILELAITAIQIVFGILLCINTEEEIKLHLIIVGIVFILSAIAQILGTVIEHRKEEKKE